MRRVTEYLSVFRSYCLSRLREFFFPCFQIVGSSIKLKKKFCTKEFKTKINTWTTDRWPLQNMSKIFRESRIHLSLSTCFSFSLLPRFHLTICTSYFFVVLHLVVFFLKISQLVFYATI